MTTRDELVAAIRDRYARSGRQEKSRILDELVAIAKIHRKHAQRLLRTTKARRRSDPRPSRRIYDEAVRESLVLLWEASDRICGKRLNFFCPRSSNPGSATGTSTWQPRFAARFYPISTA